MPSRLLGKHLMPANCCKRDHIGVYFFWQYLKKPRCGVDWDAEIYICKQCGVMLLPPRMLSLYFMFNHDWIGWVTAYITAYILKENDVKFIDQIPILACTYFIFMNVLPGLIAFFGVWKKVDLHGLTREEYINERKRKIAMNRKTWRYITIKILIAILMIYSSYLFFK